MASPILFLALLGGGAWLLLSGNKKSNASGAIPTGAGGAITVPPGTVPDHPDVEPENAPSVSVQVPGYTVNPSQVPAGGYATGGKDDQYPPATAVKTPQQVITEQLPGLVNQAAQAAQNVGSVARFPDLPGAVPTPPPVVIPTIPIGATPQQVATQVLPQLVQQAAGALTPQTPTPLQQTETHPQLDPHGTIALAKDMIDAESSSGWKSALQDRIKAWQAVSNLTADGKFGPQSAYTMALEVGVLPLIRYWPKTTALAADLKSYRDRLLTMAANADHKNPAMAAALRASAAYEQGQSYGKTPAAINPSARLAQATVLKNALGAA